MSGRVNALASPAQGAYSDLSTEPCSFDDAFALYHRVVFRTARSYVHDQGLAEDIVQEVFLRLYKNIESAPAGDMLRPWLLRVTINVALNSIRGHGRSAVRDDEYYKAGVRESDGPPQPVEDYERKQLIAQTRMALDKIREPMRSCLILKQQGLSYREIAEILNLNEASVGSYVARGRKEFVRVYGKVGSSK